MTSGELCLLWPLYFVILQVLLVWRLHYLTQCHLLRQRSISLQEFMLSLSIHTAVSGFWCLCLTSSSLLTTGLSVLPYSIHKRNSRNFFCYLRFISQFMKIAKSSIFHLFYKCKYLKQLKLQQFIYFTQAKLQTFCQMIILDVHVGYIMSLYATLQHFNSCSARNVLCEVLVVLTVYLILDMANISLKLLFTAR